LKENQRRKEERKDNAETERTLPSAEKTDTQK